MAFPETKNILIPLLIVVAAGCLSLPSLGGNPLLQLKGIHFTTYYSEDASLRAKTLSERIEKALVYTNRLTGFKPIISVYVLNPVDWPEYTTFPVYGMPHYDEKDKRLIIASADNEFWKSFTPPIDKLPASLASDVRKAYSVEGVLTMEPFFDLLAIHELGHAFHDQAGLNTQRKWMGELFANILLHTYVAENEQDLLPALVTFPRMVISGGKEQYKFTSLEDLETRYNEIGKQHPVNYGWYQSRWHAAAGDIYNAGGTRAFTRLWAALKNQKEQLGDEAFASFLRDKAHPSIANVWYHWND